MSFVMNNDHPYTKVNSKSLAVKFVDDKESKRQTNLLKFLQGRKTGAKKNNSSQLGEYNIKLQTASVSPSPDARKAAARQLLRTSHEMSHFLDSKLTSPGAAENGKISLQ